MSIGGWVCLLGHAIFQAVSPTHYLSGALASQWTACSSTIVAVDSSSQAVRMGRPGLQQIREVLR